MVKDDFTLQSTEDYYNLLKDFEVAQRALLFSNVQRAEELIINGEFEGAKSYLEIAKADYLKLEKYGLKDSKTERALSLIQTRFEQTQKSLEVIA